MKLGTGNIRLDKKITVFEDTSLQIRPYYFGSPWFLPIASVYFKVYDKFDNYRRIKNYKTF